MALFGLRYTEIDALKAQFIGEFLKFIGRTKSILEQESRRPLTADEFQKLRIDLGIIESVRQHTAFAQYVIDKGPDSFVSLVPQQLESLPNELAFRMTMARVAIDGLCNKEYSEANFTALNAQLQQLWYLLSLPSANHAQLVSDYATTGGKVSGYCLGTAGIVIGELKNEAYVNQAFYQKIKLYLAQLASLDMTKALHLEQSAGLVKEALEARARRLIDQANQVDLTLANGANITIFFGLVQDILGFGNEFAGVLPDAVVSDMQKALESFSKRIENTLVEMRTTLKNQTLAPHAVLPVQLLAQMDSYLGICTKYSLFPNEVAGVCNDVASFLQQFTQIQKQAMDESLRSFAPNATTGIAAAPIASMLESYEALHTTLQPLYAVCDNALQRWAEQLSQLVLEYQTALTLELSRAAASGGTNAHVGLLERVATLQAFDEFMKEHTPGPDKPTTFKKLHKRFEVAFKTENFAKIREVMSAVLNGDFAQAQELAHANKELAPGTDMRGVLVDQIGTFIIATGAVIERNIAQLNTTSSATPADLAELLQSYERIKAAQRLVDAGLLSEKHLAKRDNLLTATQGAVDNWVVRATAAIGEHINKLDFKTAHAQLKDLKATLATLAITPASATQRIEELEEQLHSIPQACVGQYKLPLTQWNRNKYTLAQVAKGFVDAKDLPYALDTYNVLWIEISAQVYETIDARCTEMEEQFSNGKVGMKNVVSTVESIDALIQNIPAESTDLRVKVKERYQQTIERVLKDNNLKTTDAEIDNNIALVLDASDRVITGLNVKQAQARLTTKANELRTAIMADFDKGEVSFELVYFAALHHRFAKVKSMDFFNKDHATYVGRMKQLVTTATNDIQTGSSSYGRGVNQPEALKRICSALDTLVCVQKIAMASNEAGSLVEPNLTKNVVALLLQVKQQLLANNEQFKTALTARNVTDLNVTLRVADAFKDVTMGIERFIYACALTPPLSADLQSLIDLNNEHSYVGMRNLLIARIKEINRELETLDPKTLREGREGREKFYDSLRGDIEFLDKLKKGLGEHVDQDLLAQKGVDADFGFEKCLAAVGSYLEKTFRLAHHQLKLVGKPNVNNNWSDFNRYYQELEIFAAKTAGIGVLAGLKLSKQTLLGDGSHGSDEQVDASMVALHLNDIFSGYFNNVLESFRKQLKEPSSDAFDRDLVSLLAGLQKMAGDMPLAASAIKAELKGVLKEIQNARGVNYMTSLAELLRNEEKGFGGQLVAEQPVFAGMMTAERNKLTKAYDIVYVLNHMEVQDKTTGTIRKISDGERAHLQDQYLAFNTEYDRLVRTHITTQPDFDAAKDRMGVIKAELMDLIQANQPDRDKDGHIIWNEKITKLVPRIYAHLFAIWTLNNASAYFDSTNTDSDINFLRKPHPTQMVAVFQMLNTMDAKATGLKSTLIELLTGQGKSVVNASTAALLALVGFAVDVGCYSEYLSKRDEDAFKWLFDFLNVSPYIKFGTFNKLSEDMLNQEGDLRDLVSNAILDTALDIKAKAGHGRQKIALIDEIDSLITAIFGNIYQPYRLLSGPHITALLDAIWTRHINGNMNSIKDLLNLPEYQNCLKKFPNREYIFKQAAEEMFADLKKYGDKKHEFHVDKDKEICYKHFDGTTRQKSIGYQTYWACRDQKYGISKECRQRHEGLKITCGAYSYAQLMRDKDVYRAMIGVTGTYRELSVVEKQVVKDFFGICDASFIPSANGENKMQFNPGTQFIVVNDDEYDERLCEEISKSSMGWTSGKQVRPVLVFFDTEEELEAFYKSAAFKGYRSATNKMTSKTVTTAAERDMFIAQATHAKAITLAVKEHGRGSDFMLTVPAVIANGGMAVLDGFMPETEAEERQLRGRGGRQGQDGSNTMVIKKSELLRKFELTNDQIETARRAGKLYELVSGARNKKFAAAYQEVVNDSKDLLEHIHKPSIEFLELLRKMAQRKATAGASSSSSTSTTATPAPLTVAERVALIEAHKKTMRITKAPVVAEISEAKVLILFDSTGSMGNLIAALKSTLGDVVDKLGEVLRENNCSFQLQIADYKDYPRPGSRDPSPLHHTSKWSCEPNYLKEFIETVKATGGGGNEAECLELGLHYANTLADEGVLHHVIVIGDEPPSTEAEINELHRRGSHLDVQHYLQETTKLANKKVPVSTFFTRTDAFNSIRDSRGQFLTQTTFAQIAKMTGGEAGELNLADKEKAIADVTRLFAKKIIGAVVPAHDTERQDAMYAKFQSKMQQFGGN